MKKLIKLEFNNTTRERKTEDSYSELYSHDKNNGSFEFEILNDTLTTEQVTALFKFTESNKIWKTTGTVEGNKVSVTFDTSLITRNETVICYLYFDEEQRTSDTFRFKFKVKVSEIDKMNRYEVKERFINNTVIVDRLDVVTKDELKEALKNIGGIATEGLLTETKAEELYAKKSEAVDNTNFELVKNRVLALELKTDKDTVYDDSEVKERLTTLENKAPVDLSNYATKEELRNVSGSQPLADNLVTKEELENKHYISDVSNLATKEELNEVRNSQPTVDTSNLVTKQELEDKHFLTDQALNNYALKSELYNDSDLKARVEVLEQKTDKDTVYDDTPLKERVTALESKAIEGVTYDDKPIRDRLDVLEAKHDNDTIYDDTEVKRRLTELESKPAVDTSFFVTEEKLASKKYVTEEELNNKAYLTQQNLDNYALKSEIPQPYNDSPLNERVTALESKAIEGGAYDDTDLRNRVINLENKPPLDTSEFVTNQVLENKHYITEEILNNKGYAKTSEIPTPYNDSEVKQRLINLESIDTSKFVTDEKLESKGYLKSHQDIKGLATKEELANLVTNDQLEAKHYITGATLENYALKSDIPQRYNDTEVKERLTVLENKQDKDTVYNDTELRNRVSELEQRPIATPYNDTALSDRVSALENKQDKDTVYNDSELRQRVEVLENKVDKDTVYNDEPIKERLTVLETKVDKDTVYNDSELRERVTNLENKPNVDLSNYVTNEQLENKHYLTQHQELTHLATTSDLEVLRNTSVNKAELSKKVDNTEFNSFKDSVVTKSELAEKGYISDLSNYVTKQELQEATEIDYSNIVTTDELEPYAKKSELPAPYNDSALVSRVSALESKQDKDTVYNDTEVKQRLTALENRPTTGGGLSTEDVATYTNNIIYVPNGNIVYDKNLKKLYIPKCNVKVGKTNYWCEAQEVTINGSAGFIVFNKAQKRIVGGDVNTTNDVLLGYYDNNIGNYYLNTFSKAFKKKKIACLGDSITEGVNANGWQWHRYIDKYFKENGVETTIVNLGIGGTSVCTSSYVTASLQPFVNRLNTIPTDTDVIVIFGGTNDWGNNATLGTISDTGSSSFYGAYKYMLEWFAINRPNAKILTITPLKRYFRGNTTTWVNAQTTRNNKGQLLQDYVRAVKEVSEMYAIPCVDLHNESGLNPVLEIVRTKYMGDGLHPTAEGNKKMYPIILNKLKPLVKYD